MLQAPREILEQLARSFRISGCVGLAHGVAGCARIRSGSASATLRFLCSRQRWIRARVPKVSVIALRSPLAPSIMNSSARSVGSPHSARSASSSLQAAAFSVAPSRSPSTCLWS